MSRVVLVQPAAGERISGGYLYNQRMAAHGAWQLLDVEPASLHSLDGMPGDASLVLADSIWLTEERIEPFLELSRRGSRVGVMLHSFPSMIRAAESGGPPRSHPTDFELETLERLGLLVTLGEHYPKLLESSSVRIVLAPPGVDDAWRGRPHSKVNRCRLVSVGGVTPRKGFLDVARVLADRAQDDFEWHVIGSLSADAQYAGALKHAVSGSSNVHFWGQLSPEETRVLVQQSDVLVMPSYDENHPLVLVEALAACVPAVAYAAGAARSIVGHERCGLVAPIGDRDRLAEYLDRMIRDEPRRFEFAEACFERQAEISSWQQAAAHARSNLAGVL